MRRSYRRLYLAALGSIALLALSGCFLLPNREPTAAFAVTYGVDPEDPLVVLLDASPSTDPDDDEIVSYLWAFTGDETGPEIIAPLVHSAVRSTPTLLVRYPTEGTYGVQLLVRDERGASSEPITAIVVVPNIPVEPMP